jgi:hypothetical protein
MELSEKVSWVLATIGLEVKSMSSQNIKDFLAVLFIYLFYAFSTRKNP